MKKITILAATLFLFLPNKQAAQSDTTKVVPKEVVLYKKIEQKSEQIKSQLYTTDDIYALQLKSFNTLSESRGLTRLLIAKNDSLRTNLDEANHNTKFLIGQVHDLKEQVVDSTRITQGMRILDNFMTHSAFIVSILSIALYVCRVAMVEWHNKHTYKR